jgi:hypothetical protein
MGGCFLSKVELEANFKSLKVIFPLNGSVRRTLVEFERSVEQILSGDVKAYPFGHVIVTVEVERRSRLLIDIALGATPHTEKSMVDILSRKSQLDRALFIGKSEIASPWRCARQQTLLLTDPQRHA